MSRALSANWPYWVRRRNRLVQGAPEDGTAYLLAPEVDRLIRDRSSLLHELLFSTAWYTGAKLSEILAVRVCDLLMSEAGTLVAFPDGRTVPVVAPRYRSLLTRRLRELDKLNGDISNQLLFGMTRQTASRWLTARVASLQQPGQGGFVAFPVSFHTFRHSFAFNALLFGTPLDVVQQWLGHNQAELTRRYMAYFDDDDWTLIQRIDFK